LGIKSSLRIVSWPVTSNNNLSIFKFHQLAHANSLLNEILQLQPKIYFLSAPVQSHNPHLVAWSDAAHGMIYGQSGYPAGLQLTGSTPESSILHILDCSSSKQRRVSFFSIGSEIFAAASAADRLFALTESIRALFPHATTPLYFELCVDTKGLYDTIATCMNPRITACVLLSSGFVIPLVPKKFAFYVGFPGFKIWLIVLPKAIMSCSAC
jgi:hypothetical protein